MDVGDLCVIQDERDMVMVMDMDGHQELAMGTDMDMLKSILLPGSHISI
jgi:hypothetical protein